jgi:hypothetical protein
MPSPVTGLQSCQVGRLKRAVRGPQSHLRHVCAMRWDAYVHGNRVAGWISLLRLFSCPNHPVMVENMPHDHSCHGHGHGHGLYCPIGCASDGRDLIQVFHLGVAKFSKACACGSMRSTFSAGCSRELEPCEGKNASRLTGKLLRLLPVTLNSWRPARQAGMLS